jgi:hypothetical protein
LCPYFGATEFKGSSYSNNYNINNFSWSAATSDVGFLGFVNRSNINNLRVFSIPYEEKLRQLERRQWPILCRYSRRLYLCGRLVTTHMLCWAEQRVGLDNTGGSIGSLPSGVVSNVSATRLASVTNVSRAMVIGSMNYSVDGDQWQELRGNAGGVAGYIGAASINNLTSNLELNENGWRGGGLIGYLSISSQTNLNTTSVTAAAASNLSASGNVTANTWAGGLIGYVSGPGGSVVSNNWTSSGNVTGNGGTAGGLIGEIYNVNLSNASSTAVTVNSSNANIGGLIGYSTYLTLTNGTATANTQGSESTVGGLIGSHHGTLINVSATGNVIGRYNQLGGLIGYARGGGSVTNASATGNVSAMDYVNNGDYVGGLIGNSNETPVTNATATGDVIGRNYVGGLIGYQNRDVTKTRATGNVTTTGGINVASSGITNVTLGGNYVGGLIGWQESYSVKDSSYLGSNITAQGYAGGLIGIYNGPGSASNSVFGSYANTNLTASRDDAGGLIGFSEANLSDSATAAASTYGSSTGHSYALGNLTGRYDVGGSIGRLGSYGSITNAYAKVNITADRNFGGLIGHFSPGVEVTNSHYDMSNVTIRAYTPASPSTRVVVDDSNGLLTIGGLYGPQYSAWFNSGVLDGLSYQCHQQCSLLFWLGRYRWLLQH